MREDESERGSASYRVVIEYDGTDFCGFQFQPQERTIAGELEAVLSRLFGQTIKVTGAGRTDAGVHALGQVISFTAHDAFPVERLAIALNSALPADLSARDAARVEPRFSARLSATERHYFYVVLASKRPSAAMRRFSHFEHRELDLDRMRRGAAGFVGTHDFASFCGVPPDNGDTVRTVRGVEILEHRELVLIHTRANGFVHRMVRIMVGTLLEIGCGRRPEDSLPAIFEARDRSAAGLTAPPQGLFLAGVTYPDFSSERAFV